MDSPRDRPQPRTSRLLQTSQRPLLWVLCLGCLLHHVVGRRPSEEEALLSYLFTGYNSAARPVMNSSETVSVAIQFSLMHIKELDVRSQVLTTTGLLILEWTDERLTWNPRDYGDMQELIVEAESLWKPEFAVINGAEKIYENYSNFRAIVTSEGAIHWEPGGVFKTMCKIDITYYPFDEQQCELMFGAWSYHTHKMNLTNPKNNINMDSYSENGEWQILDHTAVRDEFAYDCCPNERFAYVAFRILMRRRHTFYIMNVILPSILTSVLLLSIFFCTPGQKVQIGVVVLLSFRIFLLNVSGNIPKTSDHIPLLGIYLTCTMAITTLSMVLTVFVLNLHHVTDRPVPPWLYRLVLVYLAKVVGKCSHVREAERKASLSGLRRTSTGDDVIEERPSQAGYRQAQLRLVAAEDTSTTCVVAEIKENERAELYEITSDNIDQTSDGEHSPVYHPHRHRAPHRHGGSISGSPGGGTSGIAVINQQTALLHDSGGAAPKVDYSRDWRHVAEVFDRLFFWLFLMAILLSTLVLFHPLTDAYMSTLTTN